MQTFHLTAENIADLSFCKEFCTSLKNNNCIIVKSDKINSKFQEQFMDQMKRYFSQTSKINKKDSRPKLFYQTGYTPEYIETPNCANSEACQTYINSLTPENKPLQTHFQVSDPKTRFFWPMGKSPEPPQKVIPENFPDFERIMNNQGTQLLNVIYTVSTVLAKGMDLPDNHFTDMMKYGPHQLAPTGANLENKRVGTVLAGFHNDMNFLTIHGKSNFPGLEIWNNQGQKIKAQVPENCLIIQTGRQAELITNGYFKAGYHQVVVNENTAFSMTRESAKGKNACMWRVSSTLFAHFSSDTVLQPDLTAGQQVSAQLEKIKLRKK